MITGVSSGLVQKADGLLVQRHEVALEGNVAYPRHIFLARAPVVLEEERERARRAELGALHGERLHLVGLRERECLRGSELRGGAEVEVVAVDKHLERRGRRGRGRCADEDLVEAHLASEAVTFINTCPYRGMKDTHGTWSNSCSSASLLSSGSGSSR